MQPKEMVRSPVFWIAVVVFLALLSFVLIRTGPSSDPTITVDTRLTTPPPNSNATVTPTPTKSRTPTITPTLKTQIAVITADSKVRRLTPGVFAGNVTPLPELINDDVMDLTAHGRVTTDILGEAEVIIQGCLTLYVFQDSDLERSACRRSDAQSGLAVCAVNGMTMVQNECASLIDIQTPDMSVQTNGTWFSVTYLPETRMSIVQVYEGKVTVGDGAQGLIPSSIDRSTVAADNIWFTFPAADVLKYRNIKNNKPLSMADWRLMRRELVGNYPLLDTWMESASKRGNIPGIIKNPVFFPALPLAGQIDVQMIGTLWSDKRILNAVVVGVDWKRLIQRNWLEYNMTPRLVLPAEVLPDARTLVADRNEANRLLVETGFLDRKTVITLTIRELDEPAKQFACNLSAALTQLRIQTRFSLVDNATFLKMRAISKSASTAPTILLESSGTAAAELQSVANDCNLVLVK